MKNLKNLVGFRRFEMSPLIDMIKNGSRKLYSHPLSCYSHTRMVCFISVQESILSAHPDHFRNRKFSSLRAKARSAASQPKFREIFARSRSAQKISGKKSRNSALGQFKARHVRHPQPVRKGPRRTSGCSPVPALKVRSITKCSKPLPVPSDRIHTRARFPQYTR